MTDLTAERCPSCDLPDPENNPYCFCRRTTHMTDDELREKVAIICAEGNNGGTWATHYTDEQKDVWRARADRVIAAVREAEADELDRLRAENEELRKWIKALQAQKTRLMTSAAPLGDHTHD